MSKARVSMRYRMYLKLDRLLLSDSECCHKIFSAQSDVINHVKDSTEPLPELDKVFREHEKRTRQPKNSPTNADFFGNTCAASKQVGPDHSSARSYIIDSGADNNVINSSRRLKPERFVSRNEFVASGIHMIPDKSIGTATITIRDLRGYTDLTLHDVS